MKCPKCGFNSFDYLDNCKKCGADLQDHKAKYGLRSMIFPGLAAGASASMSPAPAGETQSAPSEVARESVDFGFDFMSDSPAKPVQAEAGQAGEDDDDALELTSGDLEEKADAGPWEEDERFADEDGLSDVLESDDFDFAQDETDGDALETDDHTFDLSDWGDLEEEEEKPRKDKGEPSDPFDWRGLDEAGRAPGNLEHQNLDPTRPGGKESAQDPFAQAEVRDQDLRDFLEHQEKTFDGRNLTGPESWDGPPGADVRSAPEETSPTPARLLAAVVDGVILASIFLLFLIIGELTSGREDGYILPPIGTLVALVIPYFLVLFSLCFCYFTLFHYLIGQTPGKMIFRLRIESVYGTPVGFPQAFLRSVGGLLSVLCCGLGYLAILTNRSGRGWNDQLAGTRLVLVEGRDDEPEPAEEHDLNPA